MRSSSSTYAQEARCGSKAPHAPPRAQQQSLSRRALVVDVALTTIDLAPHGETVDRAPSDERHRHAAARDQPFAKTRTGNQCPQRQHEADRGRDAGCACRGVEGSVADRLLGEDAGVDGAQPPAAGQGVAADQREQKPNQVVAYEVALGVILARVSPRPVCEAGSLFRDVRDERCGKEPEQAIERVHRIAVPRRSAALRPASTLEAAEDRDAAGDGRHTGELDPCEPLAEEDDSGERGEGGELRREDSADRDTVTGANREGGKPSDLARARDRKSV